MAIYFCLYVANVCSFTQRSSLFFRFQPMLWLFGLMNKWTQTNPNWYSDMQLHWPKNRVGIWIIWTSFIQTERLSWIFLIVCLLVGSASVPMLFVHAPHRLRVNSLVKPPLQITIGKSEITTKWNATVLRFVPKSDNTKWSLM